MSLIENITGNNRQPPANADFIAVMGDDASVAAVRQFIDESVILHAHVFRGEVRHLIDMMTRIERPPQQILVDISNSEMPNTDLAELAGVCPPSISVVVVGTRNDVGMFREFLQMGVDDYLVKPLTMDLLRRVLNRRNGGSAPVQKIRMGRVVAAIGTRGGVGTSTVAANLGWYLAGSMERRVALVDFDPFGGSLDLLLGTQNTKGLSEILDNIDQIEPNFVERSFVQASPRLFLLSARQELAEPGLLPIHAVLALLPELRKLFHYVILDIPQRGGELTTALVADADSLVLVTDSSVLGARETARLIHLTGIRDDKVPLMVLVNHPNQAGRAELRQRDFEEAIGRSVSHVLPFDRDAAGYGENLGKPLIAGKGALAQALRRVADDMSGGGGMEPVRKSIFDRLRIPGLSQARSC